MYKIVGLLVILAIGYKLFIHEALPETIYFDGEEYGSRQLDRSNDSNSKIYNYYSQLVSNRDYISVLYPDSGTGSLAEWSNLFYTHFEKQGFKFSNKGDNRVGVNKTVKIFMMPSQKHNAVLMYILENIKNADHLNENEVFNNLQKMTFE